MGPVLSRTEEVKDRSPSQKCLPIEIIDGEKWVKVGQRFQDVAKDAASNAFPTFIEMYHSLKSRIGSFPKWVGNVV
jgi:hypothetical protein